MQIDIFSDVVCPWCFIGKKRLDAVLSTPVGDGVELRWRPYQLYPNMPSEGADRRAFLQARYGERADPAKIPDRISSEAEDVGLVFDFAGIERMPNTMRAHRLLEYAHTHGAQHELAERLFEFYFCSGKDVGDVDVLTDAARSVGLDAQETREYLMSDEGTNAVREDLARAADVGVSGVPCYLLAGKFALPGAQTPDVMAQFIERAKARL